MNLRLLLVPLLLAAAWPLRAQSYRERINDGNAAYRALQYDEAARQYSQAREEDDERIQGYYNQGNVEYRRGAYERAWKAYEAAIKRARSVPDGVGALYNLGTSLLAAADRKNESQSAAGDSAAAEAAAQETQLRMAGYEKAIKAFKEVLKRDQDHEDARYNLVYAMRKLDELRRQSQSGDSKNKQQQKKQQKKQQKQDQQKQDQQKQDQQKQDQQKQDQQKKEQQQQQQQKQDQQKQGKPQEQQAVSEQQRKLKQQQAEQILQALERHEKELQKKQKEKRSVRVDVDKDW